ncbi:MAG: VCBS domain-containing protein [Pseudorhodoplanes sp.]|nr:VCBS domain-containing protein [Pseudorhodoplanes sp.]
MQVEVTYTDGDTTSASLDIGGQVRFEDDGHISVGDLDTIGLSGIVTIVDSFGQLNQNQYFQVGNFNINNSHGATDGSSVGELMTGNSSASARAEINPDPPHNDFAYSDTSPFAAFFSEGGVLLSDILDDFVLSDGTKIDTAAELNEIMQGSAFESLPKQVSAGGTLSFDWSFRTKEGTGNDSDVNNDFSFWTLYRVDGGTINANGTLSGGTYTYIDAGLIFDVNALYSNNLDGSGGYLRVDLDGQGDVDNADTNGQSALTSWEFGLPYSPTGLVWVNTVLDDKTLQSANPGDAQLQGFTVHGDVDPEDTYFQITVPTDGTYVLSFGVVDWGAGDSDVSQLNIDRIRTTSVIDLDSTGNVILGTTDEGSSGGVDTVSVDGSRASMIAFDRDHDGVIEDVPGPSDEVLDIPVGGSQVFAARYGTFTIESDGDYLYDGDPSTSTNLETDFPGATVYDEVFQYTVVDGDGDTSTALLTVRIDATGDRSQADNYVGSLFDDLFNAGGDDDILAGAETISSSAASGMTV